MSEWQPIETAPKDGTWVLLSAPPEDYRWDADTKPTATVGQWSSYLNGGTVNGRWQFAWYDGGYMGECETPTHWMPLPKPPAR